MPADGRMMDKPLMDWSLTFRLLAHEIRAPIAVISGYTRMLREGRLDGADRSRALEQIESAAARLAQYGRQSSDLGRWLQGLDGSRQPIAAEDLVTRAVELVTFDEARLERKADGLGGLHVPCSDGEAVSAALASLMEAAAREAAAEPVRVLVRRGSEAFEFFAGPAAAARWNDPLQGPEHGEAPGIDRGGMGLAFVLAAAVVQAHGGQIWSMGGRQGLIALRLPARQG